MSFYRSCVSLPVSRDGRTHPRSRPACTDGLALTSMRTGTSTTREYQRHHAQRYADGIARPVSKPPPPPSPPRLRRDQVALAVPLAEAPWAPWAVDEEEPPWQTHRPPPKRGAVVRPTRRRVPVPVGSGPAGRPRGPPHPRLAGGQMRRPPPRPFGLAAWYPLATAPECAPPPNALSAVPREGAVRVDGRRRGRMQAHRRRPTQSVPACGVGSAPRCRPGSVRAGEPRMRRPVDPGAPAQPVVPVNTQRLHRVVAKLLRGAAGSA